MASEMRTFRSSEPLEPITDSGASDGVATPGGGSVVSREGVSEGLDGADMIEGTCEA